MPVDVQRSFRIVRYRPKTRLPVLPLSAASGYAIPLPKTIATGLSNRNFTLNLRSQKTLCR